MSTLRTTAVIAFLVGELASPIAAVAQDGRGPSDVVSDYFAWSDASEPVAAALPPVQTPRSYRRTWAGLGMGTTVAAIFFTSEDFYDRFLGGCSGSGDIYLSWCRIAFVGGTALGGGVGALIGKSVQRGTPAGPATPVLMGSAIGAWATFLVSLPVCEPYNDLDRTELLCQRDGMPKTSAMLGGVAAGGLVGLLIARRGNSIQLDHLGLVSTPESGRALQVAFSFPGGD